MSTWIYSSLFIDDQAPVPVPFTNSPGITIDSSTCKTPLECFSLFFNDKICQYIADNTNQYATEKGGAVNVSDNNKYQLFY